MDKKILFVDDEAPILEMFKVAFKGSEYKVFTASSAKEAMDTVRKENIECIFSDIRMPEIDGLQFCRMLREQNYFGFIYAITGFGKFYELQDCRSAGFDDYFLKPLKVDVIKEVAAASFGKLERWHSRQISLSPSV